MRRYKLPNLRYWKFTDEEWSPLELYVRESYQWWINFLPKDKNEKKLRKQIIWSIRGNAKEYNVKINDIWNWKIATQKWLQTLFFRRRTSGEY